MDSSTYNLVILVLLLWSLVLELVNKHLIYRHEGLALAHDLSTVDLQRALEQELCPKKTALSMVSKEIILGAVSPVIYRTF